MVNYEGLNQENINHYYNNGSTILYLIVSVHERDFCAKCVEDTSQLDGNIAASNDKRLLGLCRKFEKPIFGVCE